MKKKIKSSIFDSIYTKFWVQLLLLAFIPLALAGIIFSYASYNNNKERKFELNNRVTASVINNINTNIEFTSRITHSLLSSNELTSFLQSNYSMTSDYDNYISSIQSYVDATIQSDSRSDTFIYMANTSIPMSIDIFYHLSDIKEVETIANFLNSDAIDAWLCSSDFTDTSNPYLFPVENRFLYLRKAYDYKKNFLGIIVFSIPENYFLSFDAENEGTVISKEHNRIINLSGDTLSDEYLSSILSPEETQYQLGSYLITKESPKNFPFTITTITKHTNYGQMLIIFLFVLICFAFVSILLCLRNIKKIVAQMNDCLTAMDNSINNNYATRIPVTGKNEISDISQRINLLLNQAAELSEQNIKKETSNKESRLIALQHQINPHFIYNTMEVFSSKMKIYGHYDESDAMVAFANIFRYNISTNDSLVSIGEEMGQIRNYLNIQKLRYPHITLVEDIEAKLMDAMIPKFTFQPIIENAIAHGLSKSSQSLTLTVSAKREASSLIICIKDNGVGMSAEQLAALQNKLDGSEEIATDGHSVGLKNVNTRLILYFGEPARLNIESEENKYTKVSFRLPLF